MIKNSQNLSGSTKSLRTTQKDTQTSVTAMIEIPKGGRNKYEYDPQKQAIRYDRMIHSSVQFPSDYGFILDTLAEDGDPLDVLVLVWEPTFPGCIIEVKPIGMLNMSDDKGVDQKILCVPINDPLWNHINELQEAPPHLLKEIKNFFEIYKTLENKNTKIEGWQDRDAAVKIIKQAQDAFVTSVKRP